MSKAKSFELPDLRSRQQAAARMDDKLRKDLNVLMAARRTTNVSDLIKWAIAQQADPIRAAWQERIDQRAEEG